MERIAGYTVDRTAKRKPKSVFIDLKKHADFIPILEENGFEIEEPIKWSTKAKRSFAQIEKGEWQVGDINNFWNV